MIWSWNLPNGVELFVSHAIVNVDSKREYLLKARDASRNLRWIAKLSTSGSVRQRYSKTGEMGVTEQQIAQAIRELKPVLAIEQVMET